MGSIDRAIGFAHAGCMGHRSNTGFMGIYSAPPKCVEGGSSVSPIAGSGGVVR